MATRPEIHFLLIRFANKDFLTAEDLKHFLECEQGVSRQPIYCNSAWAAYSGYKTLNWALSKDNSRTRNISPDGSLFLLEWSGTVSFILEISLLKPQFKKKSIRIIQQKWWLKIFHRELFTFVLDFFFFIDESRNSWAVFAAHRPLRTIDRGPRQQPPHARRYLHLGGFQRRFVEKNLTNQLCGFVSWNLDNRLMMEMKNNFFGRKFVNSLILNDSAGWKLESASFQGLFSIRGCASWIELYHTGFAINEWNANILHSSCWFLRSGMTRLLLSDEGDIFDANHLTVQQDMTQPVAHYFISASHNTYLLEDQLRGPSSVEGYIRALQSGCRCVKSQFTFFLLIHPLHFPFFFIFFYWRSIWCLHKFHSAYIHEHLNKILNLNHLYPIPMILINDIYQMDIHILKN